jgi:hypothetical protein
LHRKCLLLTQSGHRRLFSMPLNALSHDQLLDKI